MPVPLTFRVPLHAWPRPIRAVLFDRDGTLVHDVPYNADPELVRLRPGALSCVRRLRCAGLRTGVVSNQSGVAKGLITIAQVNAVMDRLSQLVGPFETVHFCPHDAADRCACRKPNPGMVLAAAKALGLRPNEVAVVGDIASDVRAAAAAGAMGVLVPTSATRAEEIRKAVRMASTLDTAADLILGVPARRVATPVGAPAGAA